MPISVKPCKPSCFPSYQPRIQSMVSSSSLQSSMSSSSVSRFRLWWYPLQEMKDFSINTFGFGRRNTFLKVSLMFFYIQLIIYLISLEPFYHPQTALWIYHLHHSFTCFILLFFDLCIDHQIYSYYIPNPGMAVAISQIFASLLAETFIVLSYMNFQSSAFSQHSYVSMWLVVLYVPGFFGFWFRWVKAWFESEAGMAVGCLYLFKLFDTDVDLYRISTAAGQPSISSWVSLLPHHHHSHPYIHTFKLNLNLPVDPFPINTLPPQHSCSKSRGHPSRKFESLTPPPAPPQYSLHRRTYPRPHRRNFLWDRLLVFL